MTSSSLSHAAQAVLIAFRMAPFDRDEPCLAAALRAAADQLGYGDGSGDPIINEYELLAIADELEAQ